MSAGWVAAGVRARGLCRRRLGPVGAARVAEAPSLAAGIAELAGTAYGAAVHADMDLGAAQHAVAATTLWHLRILAGWGPPAGAAPLRCLAAGFELANITDHLAALTGGPVGHRYQLGSLEQAWWAVSAATTPSAVRGALATSVWGDPGTEEVAGTTLALQLAWARRVLDTAPDAADWAVSGATLVAARVVVAGAADALTPGARRDAGHVLGRRWQQATSVEDLADRVPAAGRRVLGGVTGAGDLWRAEVAWWLELAGTGWHLVASPRSGVAAVVGTAGVLGADGWLVRAALSLAEGGGGDLQAVTGREEGRRAVA